MDNFKAYRIHERDGKIAAGFETLSVDDLTAGEVVVKVQYSGINYKDALAATGKGKILRKYPLNGGIDLAGEVAESADARFAAGDGVLVVSAGLSETMDGGYAEFARLPADCVMKLPAGMSAFDAMAIGTAGYTAGLAIVRMEDNGQRPDLGPVLVSGASGGVGSIAVDMLAGSGYAVTALTGKPEARDFLGELGAGDFVDRNTLETGGRPLEKALWGGAVDNVGGDVLAWLTRTVQPYGNIASIGLAGGHKLETTVMPFILRGVSLIGVNCGLMPAEMAGRTWKRLAGDLKIRNLDKIVTRTIDFAQLPEAFDGYLAGTVTGRTVVKIS